MTFSITQVATPEDIFETVNWALSTAKSGDFSDRRISERTVTHLSVDVQPIDSDGGPIGESFSAITKDVSVGGIGIICPEPLSSEQVLLRFSGARAQESAHTTLLLNIHYCNPVGPYFFVGGSFCADWTREVE